MTRGEESPRHLWQYIFIGSVAMVMQSNIQRIDGWGRWVFGFIAGILNALAIFAAYEDGEKRGKKHLYNKWWEE